MTLLELILALALAGLLLMAVSMALHIHWKAFDVRRSRVEEAQLARALLRHIGDDLRSTIKFEQPDLSGLNLTSVASGAVSGAISGGDTSGDGSGSDGGGNSDASGGGASGGDGSGSTGQGASNDNSSGGGQTGNTSTGGNTGGDSTNGGGGSGGNASGGDTSGDNTTSGDAQDADGIASGDAGAATGPSVVVGLYGTATQLQFDISRLPRVDQYQATGSADGMNVEIPSDIKTVVYFLQSEDPALADGALGGGAIEASATGTGRGLMRAESDRAASAWGEMNGSSQSLYGGAKLLAEEVTSLQFQYFDGAEWLTEWNSDDQGGLPVAIEVQLTIASSQAATDSDGTSLLTSSLATGETTGKVYRMVVHLPVGGITPAEEPGETTDTTGSSQAGGDTGSGDASGSNNSGNSSNNSGNSGNSTNNSGNNTNNSGGAGGANNSKGSGGSNGSKGTSTPGGGGKKS